MTTFSVMKHSAWSLLPFLALVTSCGGGGSDASSGDVAVITAPAPTPSPTATGTPTPTPSANPTATPTGFAAQAAALYTTQPNIAGCQAGQLSAATTQGVLATLNAIRALHRLPPVTYSPGDEAAAQAAALLQAVNDSLSHTPPSSWRCYSAAGATGSGTSNLYGGFGNGLTVQSDESILAGWLTETNNVVADSVGHRRWLLDPFLGTIAYGRVIGASPTQTRADAAAIKVFDNAGSGTVNGTLPAYVAYPFGDYPAKYFATNALLSFSVIASTSRSGSANRSVNFAGATVTVRQRGGGTLAVSKQRHDNDGYGLPNNLQFAVAGLQAGVQYDVTIDGVVVSGNRQSYSYGFRIT